MLYLCTAFYVSTNQLIINNLNKGHYEPLRNRFHFDSRFI